jgi:hypothetical protein
LTIILILDDEFNNIQSKQWIKVLHSIHSQIPIYNCRLTIHKHTQNNKICNRKDCCDLQCFHSSNILLPPACFCSIRAQRQSYKLVVH